MIFIAGKPAVAWTVQLLSPHPGIAANCRSGQTNCPDKV